MDHRYDAQWQEYRRRTNRALFAFFAFLPATFVFGIFTGHLFHSHVPFAVFGILWIIFAGVTSAQRNALLCPRCGKAFFHTWWYHNGFARRCVHCKLPLYSKDGPATGLNATTKALS